jgi:hypothetical protein
MKATLATISCLLTFAVAWLLTAGLIHGIGYLGLQARSPQGLLVHLHMLSAWVISPAVASYLAIHTSCHLFKSVSTHTIYVSFISVVAVFGVLTFLLAFVGVGATGGTYKLIVFVLQAAGVFLCAALGQAVAERKRCFDVRNG